MTAQDQLAQVEEFNETLQQQRANQTPSEAGQKPKRVLTEDQVWARKNLRFKNGEPIPDMANALRIFERHEDYKGRFKYNEMVNRVLDKGVVMIDWRIAEICTFVQERFIPGIPEDVVLKGLTIAAYRTGVNK